MEKIRVRIEVRGIVQGVGFRPFIHKQITDHSLCGWIRNTSSGAEMDLEGTPERLDLFVRELYTKKPKLALIEDVKVNNESEPAGYTDFRIISSKTLSERNTLISPDVCTCDDCVKELFDKNDRRYRYPFINCTNCGPRFTIIKDVPYDRDKTTMGVFPMCDSCRKEYTDISDRRYHAQPDCCGDCGPRLIFTDSFGNEISGDPIKLAINKLKEGKILAIKGLGGFHLATRADDAELSLLLRQRKHRDEKPFALMCADISEAEKICLVSDEEKNILLSHQRPIVLLKKRDKSSYLHISENDRIGVMLPYTPVHFLLFHEDIKTLIMTSANLSDTPVIYKNDEALSKLSGIADYFLLNNRDIHVRCDDSVMWVLSGHEYFARRSRGYVPYPITVHSKGKMILSLGAEQKASFCMSKNEYVFASQHIGDLKNIETLENYEEQIKHFENLFDIKPEALVCDLHPDYFSTAYGEERSGKDNIPLLKVQHHYAHMASCMADNGIDEKVIGIIWDGTGLGTDGKPWGGEFLTGDYEGFSRKATIKPLPLPGGDKAVKDIKRIGAALFREAGIKGHFDKDLEASVEMMISENINTVYTTSIGRLFDGVSAILGIKSYAGYEGQGAILLEACAAEDISDVYPYEIYKENGIYVFDYIPMIKAIFTDLSKNEETGICSARFMNTLCDMAVNMVIKIGNDTGIKKTVLSGGSFQNIYITKKIKDALSKEGFEVFTHKRVSANDEGLSLGQLMIAERRLR